MRLPLLLAATLVASPALAQAPTPITVHLSSFSFAPDALALTHGQHYTLTLVNDAGGGHSFGAKEFFSAATIEPKDLALISKGAVEVPGGESRTIHFTAPAIGIYKLKCTHTLHSAFGMKGQIVVR